MKAKLRSDSEKARDFPALEYGVECRRCQTTRNPIGCDGQCDICRALFGLYGPVAGPRPAPPQPHGDVYTDVERGERDP